GVMGRMGFSGRRLVVAVAVSIAMAAGTVSCSSGTGESQSAGHVPDRFVGTSVAGVALLSWSNSGGRLKVTIDVTGTEPAHPFKVVENRLSVDGRIDGPNVSLQSSS